MLRPLFDRLMPKGLISSCRTVTARIGRTHESRKAYGQLQDHQVELVPRTGEGSSAVMSAATTVTQHSEIGDELGMGRVVEGGKERYTSDGDLATGIHVQRCITVER